MTDDTTKFWDMIDHLRVAMMTTDTPNGLESRPMSAYIDKEAHTISFITSIDSGKTDELKDDAHVNLAFADSSANKYVSVTGTARVTRDPVRQKAMWNAFAAIFRSCISNSRVTCRWCISTPQPPHRSRAVS